MYINRFPPRLSCANFPRSHPANRNQQWRKDTRPGKLNGKLQNRLRTPQRPVAELAWTRKTHISSRFARVAQQKETRVSTRLENHRWCPGREWDFQRLTSSCYCIPTYIPRLSNRAVSRTAGWFRRVHHALPAGMNLAHQALAGN